MRQGLLQVSRLALTLVVALSMAAPTIMIHPSPSAAQQANVTVQKMVTTSALGNTVVTERQLIDGMLVKEEITVTSPQGQLISKTEITLDPATGQVVKREAVTVVNGVATKVEEKFINGKRVQRKEEIKKVEDLEQEAAGHGVEQEHGVEVEHSGGSHP